MPRPAKKQINIKMPEPLIEALKTRAIDEGDTFTDLVIRFCSEGLGSKSDVACVHAKGDRPITVTEVAPTQLDERIAEQLAPLQERLVALETELMGVERLREEAESLRQQSQQLPDYEAIRDRILSGLKVGKQSPEYKRTKASLDRFIALVQSNPSSKRGAT